MTYNYIDFNGETFIHRLYLTNKLRERCVVLSRVQINGIAPNLGIKNSETRLNEHAAEQRRHRIIQRDFICRREDVAEDQDRGQH